MHALFFAGAALTGLAQIPIVAYATIFIALVLGGYVAGHLEARFPIFFGALAAVAYIFVTVTLSAAREVSVARQFGMSALAPIDFVQLTVTDVVAMVGASCGGWLAGRS